MILRCWGNEGGLQAGEAVCIRGCVWVMRFSKFGANGKSKIVISGIVFGLQCVCWWLLWVRFIKEIGRGRVAEGVW